jgi:hypothetical protein
MNIPPGFKNLACAVESAYRKKPDIVETDEDFWKYFCWAALLGKNRSEAEVEFVHGILDRHGLLERKNLDSDWAEHAKSCLQQAEEYTEEPNKKGKMVAIHKVVKEIEDINTTLKSADLIFEKNSINCEFLRSIVNDRRKIEDLLANIASYDMVKDEGGSYNNRGTHINKIPGVAYTKALLWLHSCGIGLNLVPDNNHIQKFLVECYGSLNDTSFFVINHKFTQICTTLHTDIYFSGSAVWCYEATKSLVSRKYSKDYKPKELLWILKQNDLPINDIYLMLSDIEKIECLQEILNSSMKAVIRK